jgi:aminoglycoside phosphotransferase (APT) family kinase protein
VAAVSGTVLDPADAAWLRRVLPGRRITAAEPLGGGYRNENIRLVTDGGSYVLRRYLRGDAARTCAIEAALAVRLAAEAVPAAEVIAADPEGGAAGALSPAEIGRLRALAAAADPLARSVGRARQLVHSDYNGKNLLAVGGDGRWSISAVLDWEFAFSGSPLTDVGNMLRFRACRPPGFAGGFVAGYRDAGGQLPERWREISEALDLYALADFLTRPPGHRYIGKAVAALKDRLERGAPS